MSGGLLGGLQYGMRCFAAAFILAMLAKMSPGEKSLTNDLEKLSDGQGEAGTVYVDEYHQFDQCMAQPGYHDVYSHTIAFQLFPDQMNSGTGLLFCYQGQLDRFNHVNGMVMKPDFLVANLPGNAVGNVCENARHELKSRCREEKDPGKCEDFVEYPWHGLQVVDDPNDPKNIIITMSTTNESFIIGRHEFRDIDGLLYLKLANEYHVRSVFSRQIGPSSVLQDSIDVSHDFARHNNFMRLMDKGRSFLHEQMGIFALGMDILLKDQRATELPFFIIRSACSEMSAAMLHPFEHAVSSLSKSKAKKKKPNQWKYPLLVENSILWLRGQIEKDAESFEINLCVIHEWTELICGPVSSTESKVSNITLKYDFMNNKTILQTTLFNSADGSMVNETVVTIEGSTLHKGQNFLMKATALNDGFNISLNCAPIEYFPVYEKLPFNQPLNFKISGATIYEMSKNEPAKTNVLLPESAKVQDNWNVTVGNDSRPLSNGRGLLFRGNVTGFWRIFKITFINNMSNQHLFTFDAKNKENKILLKWLANDNDSCAFTDEIENTFVQNAECNCFELYFEFEEKAIKTFLNGKWIYHNSEVANVVEVAHIKLDADIKAPLELNQTTWTVPETGRLFDLNENFENMNVLNIHGKFFDKATFMNISFIYFKQEGSSPLEECWTDVLNQSCRIVLDINIVLNQNLMLLQHQIYDTTEKKWKDADTQMIPTTQFVPGKPFELTIRAIKKDANNKFATFKIDQIDSQMKKPFPKDGDNARFILVSMDYGVLYEEPKIVK